MTREPEHTLKPFPMPGKTLMRFEWFTIKEFNGHELWLEVDEGEGMSFPKAEMMGFLAKIWERH